MIILILIVLCHQSMSYDMKVSFCDGNRYMEYTHDQCPFGINFGESKPDCVCIKGAYRMWLDNCAIYDGFMEQGCSTLKQDDVSVIGLRLSGSIGSLMNETAVILGLKETDYQVWDTHGIGSRIESSANNLYVVNGIASLSDNSICIHPKGDILEGKQVCRIFRSDNPIWKTGFISIEVAHVCPENSVQLQVQNCYDVIQHEDQSECSLACRKPDHPAKVVHLDEPFPAAINLLGRRTGNDAKTKGNRSCKIQSQADTRDEKNDYVNRKLNRYAKLRQVKDLDRPNLLNLMPRRSWILFDIMKQIAQEKCPPKYVSRIFMEQTLDLFILIHQGKGIRHPEILKEAEYEQIFAKLMDCKVAASGKPLPMYGPDDAQECGAFEKLVGASIPHPPGQMDYFINETIELDQTFYKFTYHFVIDAAWKIFDMVHNLCLDAFTDEFYLFHAWAFAMEKLFTTEIRSLWFFPKVDVRIYQILLSPSAITDLYNLEMCTLAAYMTDPRLKRLKRPKLVKTFYRKKRSMQGIVTRIHDVHCQQSERDFQYPC